MSEKVCYIGKVKVVAEGKENSEKYAKKVCEDRGIKISDYWLEDYDNSYAKILQLEDEDYVFSNDNLYRVVEITQKKIDEIISAEKTIEGASFGPLYYNLREGFSVCLQKVLDKI